MLNNIEIALVLCIGLCAFTDYFKCVVKTQEYEVPYRLELQAAP